MLLLEAGHELGVLLENLGELVSQVYNEVGVQVAALIVIRVTIDVVTSKELFIE